MKYENVILIGSGKIACDCLDCLMKYTSNIEVVEYVGARSLSFFKSLCLNKKIDYYSSSSVQDLSKYFMEIDKTTLIISANNNYIFHRDVLLNKNLTIINFHNSLLPNYPGRNAPTWVIFDLQQYTGITWHFVDEGLDTGNIIAQETVKIRDGITAIELAKQCMNIGSSVFQRNIQAILSGDITAITQDIDQRENFHQSNEMPNNGQLDLSWPIAKMSAFLRSINYGKIKIFPNPYTVFRNCRFRINGYSIETMDEPVDHPVITFEEKLFQVVAENQQIRIVVDREGSI